MKLTFYGAARQVTGSCYLLETDTKKILIDCGLFQGARIAEDTNLEPFPFNAAELDAVCITHAHIDHCGRVPKLVKEGYAGPVYATGPTARIALVSLEDSARILGREAEEHNHDPVYDGTHVETLRGQMQEVEYREVINLGDGVMIEFFDAGHILGSSMIRVTHNGTSVVFSGDIGNPPVPILQPTDTIGEADYVVMESTYGGRVHEDKAERTLILKSAIYETIKMNGVLMIPAFAIERTQELLYELNGLVESGEIPPIPIFLDSPLAIKATKIFKEFDEYFNHKTQSIIRSGDDVFHFPGLKMTETSDESKAINDTPSPKVIIAGSGMANGGRILHHIKRYISNFANQYLIVGYQVHGSLGRRLLDGEKTIRVHHEDVEVKAKIRAIGGYSAHADQPKLTAWLSEFDRSKLKHVFLTHGEEDQAGNLQRHFEQRFTCDISIPEEGTTVELA